MRPNVAFGAFNAPKAALGASNAPKATLGRLGLGAQLRPKQTNGISGSDWAASARARAGDVPAATARW